MLEFNFSSEAEIFSSDLRFKMFDNSSENRYRSNMPLKNEDSMSRLKSKLGKITDRYTCKFQELVGKHENGQNLTGIPDQDAKTNIAVATYLATYLDCNNTTKDYFEAYQDDERFHTFLMKEILNENPQYDSTYHEKMKKNFESYKTNCKKIANGDTNKQMKML